MFDTSSSWLEMFVSGRNQKPIICVIPICVQLFMVAGFVFGITAHNVVAVWTESTLSVVVGRFFFRETIREKLFAANYPISRRWLLILEDEGHALAYQACSRFMIIPLFVDIPSWKISLACVHHAAWFSVLVASIGDSVSHDFSLEKAWWSAAPDSS